jgi:hypothetical protein
MAISPQSLDFNFQRDVDRFEEIIDRQLVNSKLAKGGGLILDIPPGMNFSHFEILKERYIKVGWTKIEWKSDQREGDWLTFTS